MMSHLRSSVALAIVSTVAAALVVVVAVAGCNSKPKVHPKVSRMLAEGWKVAGLQRLTDRDALVTLDRAPSDQA